jgi:hypothetical protein
MIRRILLVIFAFASVNAFSQPCPPGDNNCNGEGDPGFPFDGGISLVIAAGAGLSALGLKKHKNNNKGE